MRRVGHRRVCPHRRGDHGRFRQHRVSCSGPARIFHMYLNAVRTLRCQRDRHRYQLLVQDIEGAVFEQLCIKSPESLHHIRRILIELLELSEISHIKHVSDSFSVLLYSASDPKGCGERVWLYVSGVTLQTHGNRKI